MKLSLSFAVSIVALMSCSPLGYANDWPQWRGPDRNGIAENEPPLISSWPEDGPPMVWEYPDPGGLKGGLGSVVLADGKVFTVVCPRFDEPILTRRLGADQLSSIGWFPDELPDELATKLELARLSEQRAALGADEVAPWAEQWLTAHLTDEQYGLLAVAVRSCLERGPSGVSIEAIAKLGEINDKTFESTDQLEAWLLEHDLSEDDRQAVHAAAIKTVERARDELICLDALSGAELWKKAFEAGPVKTLYYGSSGTPCVDAGRVYFVSSAGWAFCVSAEDGREIWRTKTRAESDASFMVADGIAVVPADELLGLDADTGAELWAQPEVKTKYNSAVLWRSKGAAYVICNTDDNLKCVALATGKMLWQVPGGLFSTATIKGDYLAVLTDNKKAGLNVYELSATEPRLLWSDPFNDRGASPVIYDGHVYAVGSGNVGCFKLDTGQVLWQQDVGASTEVASPIIADGKLITVVAQNRLMMLAATPERAIVLAEADAKVKFSSSPAIANGLLYLRHFEKIACYDLKSTATP